MKDTPRSDHTFSIFKASDREFVANHSWNPQERVIIRGMEGYFGRSEDVMVVIGEMDSNLLAPSDGAGISSVLAKNACDGGGSRRFEFIQEREGSVVAVAGRYAAEQAGDNRAKAEVDEWSSEGNSEESPPARPYLGRHDLGGGN